MSQQNLLGVGFDTAQLQADAKQVEQIVEALYAKLRGYDNVKLQPIDVTGLTQLTQAIQSQQQQLNGLTQSMNNLVTAMNSYNTTLGQTNTTQQNAGTVTGATTQAVNANTAAITANTNALNANKGAGAAQQNQQQKFAAMMGKNALAQNDLYRGLVQKQEEIAVRWRNAIIKGDSPAVIKSLEKDLQAASAEVEHVNTAFNRATSSGITNASRGLSTFFGGIRQLAYILPGLGIAGIFNLAFEAIGNCIEALGFFDNEVQKTIEYNEKLAASAKTATDAMIGIADATGELANANVQRAKDEKAIAEASGENFAQQIDDVNNLLATQKEAADQRVQTLKATKEGTEKLNEEIITSERTVLATQQNINDLNQKLRDVELKGISLQEKKSLALLPAAMLRKTANVNYYKDEIETQTKLLEATQKDVQNKKTLYNAQTDALKKQSDVSNAISEESAKRSKYFSDEARKIALSNAEATFEGIKTANEKVLKNELSTEAQRLEAIQNIAKAERDLALAKRQNVLTKIGVTDAESIDAVNDYNSKVAQIEQKAYDDSLKTSLQFWLQKTEIIHQAKDAEIRMQQVKDKSIVDNEILSYEARIVAYENYVADRRRSVEEDYQNQLAIAQKKLPADVFVEKKKQLDAERKTKMSDIDNDIYKQSYDIASTWYQREVKQIKEVSDVEIGIAEDQATQEFLMLNESFNKKEISYRQFLKKREKLEYQTTLDIDRAREKDDVAEIARLEKLQETLTARLGGNIIALMMGGGDETKGAIKATEEELKTTQENVTAATNQYNKDKLKTQKDAAQLEMDARKATYENWMALEQEAFNFIQTLGDSIFEAKMERLQMEQDAYDKSVENELTGIERSTIAAKEKNAYDIQLNAQKTARDEEYDRKQRKLKHDQAVFDKEVGIAQIITNTAVGISGALANAATIGPAAIPLAISIAALGAVQLATAIATRIPAYGEGGTHEKDGLALFGEAGHELVKEPHRKPYIADKPTIAHLPAGTELFPLYDIPVFLEKKNDSWAQTLYLGKQIAKSKREIKNVFKPKINIDLGKQIYINRILHG
jgi:hypothetical protein